MGLLQLLCIHLDDGAVIGHEAVNLALYVGGLGIDGGGEALVGERLELGD